MQPYNRYAKVKYMKYMQMHVPNGRSVTTARHGKYAGYDSVYIVCVAPVCDTDSAFCVLRLGKEREA